MIKKIIRNLLPLKTRQNIKALLAKSIGGEGLLGKLSDIYMSDKNMGHNYAKHYARMFSRLRNQPITLLEIGIGGYSDPHSGGASLRTWRSYFPKGKIVGVDIHPKFGVDGYRIKTFCGSQDDSDFLNAVIKQIGPPDIIIDDGSHINSLTIKTFEILFPLLRSPGIYIVEDLQTSYWPELMGVKWGGSIDLNSPDTSMGYLKRLVDCVNQAEFLKEGYERTYFDKNIVGISFFHNLCVIEKSDNNEISNIVGKINGNEKHPQND